MDIAGKIRAPLWICYTTVRQKSSVAAPEPMAESLGPGEVTILEEGRGKWRKIANQHYNSTVFESHLHLRHPGDDLRAFAIYSLFFDLPVCHDLLFKSADAA